jgi:hypothetical protein
MKLFKYFFLIAFIHLAGSAWGRESCLKNSTGCDPEMLCSFKAEYYSKLAAYTAYVQNAPSTKKNKSFEGIRYNGQVYKQAMDEAKRQNPQAKPAQLKELAGSIFQELIAEKVRSEFKLPECEGSAIKPELHPKQGYNGMYTDSRCQVWVNFEEGQIDPNGFGSGHTTCPEFYRRDLAHEKIHQKLCLAAQAKGHQTQRESIDQLIEEEIAAYKHSVQLSQAYMQFLSLQCSTSKKAPEKALKKMKKINSLLEKYEVSL